MKLDEGKIWIKDHLDFFKGLEPGVKYAVFFNEDPIIDIINPNAKEGTARISKKGNKLQTKIRICPGCGKFQASSCLRLDLCTECQLTTRSARKKAKKKIKIAAKKKKYTTDLLCVTCAKLKSFCQGTIGNNCDKYKKKTYKKTTLMDLMKTDYPRYQTISGGE